MIKYKDFAMGILLKALQDFLNNKYLVINFFSNKDAILLPGYSVLKNAILSKKFGEYCRNKSEKRVKLLKVPIKDFLKI